MLNINRPQSTVVSVLSQNARDHGDRTALEASGDKLTYAQLEAQSTALALHLIDELGVKSGDRVGLCIDPSFDMVVGLLAILKAGAAYVPIDANLPRHRIAYVIRDAQLQVVLAEQRFNLELSLCCTQAQTGRVEVLDSAAGWRTAWNRPEGPPEPPSEEALAYLIYTSGSTGEPKGVMIEHRGLLNLAVANREILGVGATTRLLQFASLSFDAATWEIFSALIGGATLVLGQREELMPGRNLAQFLMRHRITMLCIPPSLLALMDAERPELRCLQTVVVAGEPCPLSTARAWSSSERRFFNAYGPTEATVCATMHLFRGTEDAVPIGDPLPGVTVEILDDSLRRVPAGTVGELCIGGMGVGRGYLNKPALTERSFVSDPWGSGRMYRTGDLVVADPVTGSIRFVGRKDNRIKVRGFRVELEAIERALCEHPDILAAAVGTQATRKVADASIDTLVGYFVARSGLNVEPPTPSKLRDYLAARLPEYMVPHVFMRLDALPMMANGSKVDRRALPAPAATKPLTADCAGDELTSDGRVARIYESVLLLEPGAIGPDMDFFQQGGTSLHAAEALVLIEREFGVRIPSRKLYDHPTPRDMAALIERWQTSRGSLDHVLSNLRSDAKLPDDVRPGNPASVQGRPQCALVTGATGFLGLYLASRLVELLPELDVFCLIRAQSEEQARERLRQSCLRYGMSVALLDRVSVVAGDIEDSALALTDDVYSTLAGRVDTVYHCAADISYVKPYSVMRGPNVTGTQNLLKFAVEGHAKSFHYVSTAAVFGATGTFLGINSVDEGFNIDQSLELMSVENGYTQSKWVAEKMVQAASHRGLRVSIYRPGFIQGDSRTGTANVSDLLCRLICGCIQMGSYPDFPEKYWLPIPVDVTAEAIVHASISGKPGTYHLAPERDAEVSHNEIFDIANSLGFVTEPIAAEDWFQRLAHIDSSNALFPIASFLLEKVHRGRNTILEVHHRTPVCETSRTRDALRSSGIELPNFDAAAIKRHLNHFVAQGLIDEPRCQKRRLVCSEESPPSVSAVGS